MLSENELTYLMDLIRNERRKTVKGTWSDKLDSMEKELYSMRDSYRKSFQRLKSAHYGLDKIQS